MKEIINVFFGEKSIIISKDSNFFDLKQKIFFRDKVLIKAFTFAGTKISENSRVYNYPKFKIHIDKAEYIEFSKGKFRCKRCRKYVKTNKIICNHTSKCRTFYNFKLKQSIAEEISDGYNEEENVSKEDEIDEEEIDKKVSSKINEIFERHKRSMIQKLNDLLYK